MAIVGAAAGYVGGRVQSLAEDQIHAAEEELFKRLLASPKRYVSILLNLDEEIEVLKRILPGLKEVILSAEVKPETKELYGALKSFYEDAEDILDEYKTVLDQAAWRRKQRSGADSQRSRFRSLLNLVCGCLPCFDFFDFESVPLRLYKNVAGEIVRLYDAWEEEFSVLVIFHPVVKNFKDGLRCVRERTTKVQFDREITGGLLTRDAPRVLLGREKKALHDEITFLKKILPELQKVILNTDTHTRYELLKDITRFLRSIAEDAGKILDEFVREMAQSSDLDADQQLSGFRAFLMNLVRGCLPFSRLDLSDQHEPVPVTLYVEIANQIKGVYDHLEVLRGGLDMMDQNFADVKDITGLLRDRTSDEVSRARFRSAVEEGVTKKVAYQEIVFLRKILHKIKKAKRAWETVWGESPDIITAFVSTVEYLLEAFNISAGGGHWEDLPCSSYIGSLCLRTRTAKQIKELHSGLEKLKSHRERARQFIADAREAIKGQPPEADGPSRRPVEGALLPRDYFVGREEVKKQIVEELFLPSKPSVVLVTGMGGVGKTTLVYDIFHRQDIAKGFPFRKWVTVGNELDPDTVMGKILGKEKVSQEDILSELKDKLFLIVLDDCWSGKLTRWEELWIPLTYGSNGSKVIVTSRVDVSGELKPANVKRYPLDVLSDEECLQIFKSCAFPGGVGSTSVEIHSKLRKIGKAIVAKKIKGLPLLASVLGSSLRYKEDEKAWKNVLTVVSDGDDYVIPVLMWSYRRLPSHLKQCFAYLSMFPKDTKLEKGEMIHMWMAHGYVQPRYKMTLEDIGEIYIDDLVRASLIQKWRNDSDEYYYMHDLIHDLATNVTANGCNPYTTVALDDYKPTSHLFVEDDKNTKLRSLLFCVDHTDITRFRVQHVRVLSISRKQYFTRIHFEKMIHLRYLDLSGVQSDTLPESICNIYNLQTLLLNEKVDLIFPLRAWNLPNLRRLEGGTHIRMAGIRNSTSLHIISNFNLSNEGEDIEELAALKELRGKLKINHLSRIQSPQSASNVQLSNKEYIDKLVLDWEDSHFVHSHIGTKNEMQNDILNNLRPRGSLGILEIRNYMGDKFPSWMRSKHVINLVQLSLHSLHHIVELPPLGDLPILEKLHILGLWNVRCIGDEFYGTDEAAVFPSLKVLELRNMEGLKKWVEPTSHKDRVGTCFSSLERLHISGCKMLRSIPRRLPRCLKQMIIISTELEALPEIVSVCSNDDSDCGNAPCLQELEISDCASLCPDEWFRRHRMPSLQKLELRQMGDCTNLIINYSRKCLTSLKINFVRALRSITLFNLDPLEEYGEAAYPKLCIELYQSDELRDVAIVNRDGKITDGPLKLEVIRCEMLQESLSKFPLDPDYNINNEVDLKINSLRQYCLNVNPRRVC